MYYFVIWVNGALENMIPTPQNAGAAFGLMFLFLFICIVGCGTIVNLLDAAVKFGLQCVEIKPNVRDFRICDYRVMTTTIKNTRDGLVSGTEEEKTRQVVKKLGLEDPVQVIKAYVDNKENELQILLTEEIKRKYVLGDWNNDIALENL